VNFTSPLREITYHMGSRSVTCHPAEVTFPPLPQPKLVLDLATPKGCKAELTKIVYPKETVTYLRKTGNAVTGIRTHDSESQVRHPYHYTTEPPLGKRCAYMLTRNVVNRGRITQ